MLNSREIGSTSARLALFQLPDVLLELSFPNRARSNTVELSYGEMVMASKLVLTIAVAALYAAPAFALLSGFYDSGEKIMTILSSSEVASAVREAPVGAISEVGKAENGNSLWSVRVQDCDVLVELLEVPPDGTGMVTYIVESVSVCE